MALCRSHESLPAAGSAYQLLQTAGKSDAGFNYRRFHRAIDRLYGVMYEAYYAIYHPVTKERIPRFRFKFIEDDTLKDLDEAARPRGLLHISDAFYTLVQQGYLKVTDMERYWRLPVPTPAACFSISTSTGPVSPKSGSVGRLRP